MNIRHLYDGTRERHMATNGNGLSKFTPGAVAEVIALARPGEEVPSGFEPFRQMRYDLVDGRTWYAALSIGVKINNLELGVGEQFRVCKRPFGNGAKTTIDVMRCNPAAPNAPTYSGIHEAKAAPGPIPAPPPPTPIRAASQPDDSTGTVMEAKLKASIAAAQRPPQPPAPPAAPPASMTPAGDPGPTPNGHHLPPPVLLDHAQFYLQRATELIDVFAAAFRYSTTAYNGTLSKEDIRALVTTVYITHSKGGR